MLRFHQLLSQFDTLVTDGLIRKNLIEKIKPWKLTSPQSSSIHHNRHRHHHILNVTPPHLKSVKSILVQDVFEPLEPFGPLDVMIALEMRGQIRPTRELLQTHVTLKAALSDARLAQVMLSLVSFVTFQAERPGVKRVISKKRVK